ncbi:MAG TPA: hypothetical protein VGL39_07650 [Jatrophihabitantaceae bacterium]|jgi:2,4-dienoyl-CoA reductase-like NADH-dependent reductase (Old Yellow Enzyme family)
MTNEAGRYDAAFAEMRSLHKRAAINAGLRRKGGELRKAAADAGQAEMSTASVADLIRAFVAGSAEASRAAADEIAVRTCQGMLQSSTPTLGVL